MKQNITAAEYINYNANTRGTNTTDCTRRSISLALNIPYNEISKQMNRIMKELRVSNWRQYSVIENLLRQYGVPDKTRVSESMTVEEFADLHNTGTYLLGVNSPTSAYSGNIGSHMVCVLNGNIYDSWDCTSWKVNVYWKIPTSVSVDIDNVDNLAEYITKSLIDESVKVVNEYLQQYITKFGMDGAMSYITSYERLSTYAFSIYCKFRMVIGPITENITWKVPFVFTPRTTPEEAKQQMTNSARRKIHDKFYEINKKIKSDREGAALAKQAQSSSSLNTLWLTPQEQRFYNSLPGWVKPFVTRVNVGAVSYWDRYQLYITPIPTDNLHTDPIEFYGNTSEEIKYELNRYKTDLEIPSTDYQISDIF